VGSAYDNALLAESFAATLKKSEPLYVNSWPTRECSRKAIFEHLQSFYKRTRLHSALAYRSPADFEEGKMQETSQCGQASVLEPLTSNGSAACKSP
jgi:putative transposase